MVPLPKSLIRVQVLEQLRKKWDVQWEEYGEAWQSKSLIMGQNKQCSKEMLALNRVDLRRLFLAITRHNYLHYHISLCSPELSLECRFFGLEDETFLHFIGNCTKFIELREQTLAGWKLSPGNNDEWKVDNLMKFIKDSRIGRNLDEIKLQVLGETPEVEIEEWDWSSGDEEGGWLYLYQ